MSLHKGDIGKKISVICGSAIDTAIAVFIRYQKPSGEYGYWAATKDIPNSKIYYVTTSINDLDEEGHWSFQPLAVYANGRIHGTIVQGDVEATLHP